MKRIIFSLLLIVLSLGLKAQKPLPNYTWYDWYGKNRFFGPLRLPLDTLPTADTGSIAYKNGTLYIKDTTGVFVRMAKFSEAGSGSSADSTIFATLYRMDTMRANLYQRLGLKPDTSFVVYRNGNAGLDPASYYIGTRDSVPLIFKISDTTLAAFVGVKSLWYPVPGYREYLDDVSLGAGALSRKLIDFPNSAKGIIAIGPGALRKFNGAAGGALVAIGRGAMRDDTLSYRSVHIGEYNGYMGPGGDQNTSVGAFGLEVNRRGGYNSAFGSNALRSNKMGSFNGAFGFFSLLQNNTVIDTILVTEGGAGYTSAPTVVISSPDPATAGTLSIQATATAVLEGDSVKYVVMTNKGAGYGGEWQNTPVTVTFSGGGGAGATAVPVYSSGEYNNAFGYAAGAFNRAGKHGIYIGTEAGMGLSNASPSYFDDDVIFIGRGASRSTYVPWNNRLLRAAAIGYNAKVGKDSTIALGATGFKVVIGADTTNVGFEVVSQLGAKIDSITIDAKGLQSGELTSMAIGINAMKNASGYNSTAIGYKSQEVPSGTSNQAHNTSVGAFALRNVAQYGNSAFGSNAANSLKIGYRNTAIGAYSLQKDTGASSNTAVGFWALNSIIGNGISSGALNVGIGDGAGASITTGSRNTSVGAYSMGYSTLTYFPGTARQTGSNNTGIGVGSLYGLTSGSSNVGIGYNSGQGITDGSFNVIIGGYSASSYATANRRLFISDGEGNLKYSADSIGNSRFYGTGGHKFQSGTTAQRPTNEAGIIRWNTDSSAFEYADGAVWKNFGTTTGSSSITVDSLTYNGSQNRITLNLTGQGDVSVTLPFSYLVNPVHPDSILFNKNDSVTVAKAVTVESQLPDITINTVRTDTTLKHQLIKLNISEPIISFTAGAGFAADTTVFTDSTLYGSFYTGQDSFYITRAFAVLKGQSGDTLGIQIIYNDSINVTGTVIGGGTFAVNSRTVGNDLTISSNQGVPPGSWVWLKSPTVIAGKKPEYLSITLIGYRRYVAP